MDQLIFNFSATDYNGWPQARIVIDDAVVTEFVANTNSFTVAVDIKYSKGIHQLEIQRYGKTDNNVLFVNGEILQDQLLTLESIYFNNIKLADQFLYRGKLCWNNQEHPSVLVWGVNGSWKWQFGIPFVQWAVDSSEHLVHPDLVTPHKSNAVELKNKIQSLRKVWQ